MGDDIGLVISLIHLWFEDLYFLLRDAGALQPAYQFFCFSGEHGATDDLNPAIAFFCRPVVLQKYHACAFTRIGDEQEFEVVKVAKLRKPAMCLVCSCW